MVKMIWSTKKIKKKEQYAQNIKCILCQLRSIINGSYEGINDIKHLQKKTKKQKNKSLSCLSMKN